MFRDQRLGETSRDILDYLSSREADQRIFKADLLVDRAHLVMLKEKSLISEEVYSKIISALDEIGEKMPMESGEDIHEAIEAAVIARVGPDGGRMHTARSRNDEVATCIRLALREEMLELMAEELAYIRTLVRLAAEHIETIIPGFTHTQHAQPTTLAHHLLAHADAAFRDLGRLEDAYSRVNQNPLGAAAFASTGFDIDRTRTSDLLGFEGLVENSMDAVSSRDFILEVMAALSIIMINCSRLAEEMILWSTTEFGYLELDNLYASTSSIMPQKKNPDTAELARAKTGSTIGSFMAALSICKALPMSYNRDLQEVTAHLWRSLDWTRSTLRILEGSISTLKFNTERMEECSGTGFSTATELADSLVRITGMPFRTAHRIVGRIAAGKDVPGLARLDEISLEVWGFSVSERGFSENDLLRAIDPKSNVALQANTGGPAAAETARMIRERERMISAEKERLAGMRSRVDGAIEVLLSIMKS